MDPPPCNRINRRPTPRRALGIANFKIIRVCICSSKNRSAANAWTAVGAGGTVVRIIEGAAIDKGGEDSTYERSSVAGIVLWLQTGVADTLSTEIELLGEVVAMFMGSVCDVDREGNVCERRWRDAGYSPW